MNREEILEKSRKENKNKDIYEKEVILKGSNAGAITGAILATIFFMIQIFLGEGINYALYSIVFAMNGATFVVKSIHLKRKHEVLIAIMYLALALIFATAHIIQLFDTCKIL